MKPRIVRKVLKEDEELVEMEIKDTVKAIGNSGFVSIPKELIGSYVLVNIKRVE